MCVVVVAAVAAAAAAAVIVVVVVAAAAAATVAVAVVVAAVAVTVTVLSQISMPVHSVSVQAFSPSLCRQHTQQIIPGLVQTLTKPRNSGEL